MKNATERMDVLATYQQVGSYRGAAAICGTTHKTVARIVAAHEAGDRPARRPGGVGSPDASILVLDAQGKQLWR